MSDNLRMGLASVPIVTGWGGGNTECQMGKPAVAVMRDPIKVFVAAERFLMSPLQIALMMEESLGFVRPADLSLVEEYVGKMRIWQSTGKRG